MDLMFGCLGNGTTVWDRSRNNAMVCHISQHGHVRFYENEHEIPSDCIRRIIAEAGRQKEHFMQLWEKKSALEKYVYMMNVPTLGCGFNAFTKIAHENRHLSIEERVRQMEGAFFDTHM